MKNKISKIFGVIFILIIGGTFLRAQTYNDALRLAEPGIINSAAALGMGNATMGEDIGYSNFLNNPAALGLANSTEFVLSFNFDSVASDNSFFNNKINVNQNSNGISELGFLYKVPTSQGSMVFGFGYSQIKDFNNITQFSGYNPSNTSMIQDLTSVNSQLTYDLRLSHGVYDSGGNYLYDETLINGGLQQEGTIQEKGELNTWQFSGAVEVAKNLYVGATINLLGGKYSNDREYSEIDTKNLYGNNLQIDPDDPLTVDFQEFDVNDNISWDIDGLNLKAGFVYDMSEKLRLSGAIQTPTSYDIKETYFVQGSSYFKDNYGYDVSPQTSKSEYSVLTPFVYSFGVNTFYKFITLSAEAELLDYSQTEFTDGFTEPERIQKNKDIANTLGFAPRLRFGTAIDIPDAGITLKGGYIYAYSPFVNAPKENNKQYFTGGIDLFTDNVFVVDIAGAYGYWKDYTDIYGEGVARVNRDVTDLKIVASLKYKF